MQPAVIQRIPARHGGGRYQRDHCNSGENSADWIGFNNIVDDFGRIDQVVDGDEV